MKLARPFKVAIDSGTAVVVGVNSYTETTQRAGSLGGSTGRLAFRAGLDLVRRVGARWSFDLGAEIQAGLRFTPSMKNNTTIGTAAATADTARLPAIGS